MSEDIIGAVLQKPPGDYVLYGACDHRPSNVRVQLRSDLARFLACHDDVEEPSIELLDLFVVYMGVDNETRGLYFIFLLFSISSTKAVIAILAVASYSGFCLTNTAPLGLIFQ